ncbi:transcription antitermination factor NusB [Desulfohalobium retbaense]|uniref:NusB/RsmB/TIM44 n=1 Tax=Desulfohalobium retbaense (strain ATCC 49708 / DSM 5692 / JCM 16813 / HR100) TaxID=485915 RepID=C8WZ45_DESRD|nr:transcription antitermination factor NusB [Desulfohalobium retbaense]ACV67320.1 NusB/RsmB/TIM44 [Desulfohalobium retbaense DSM 5692]
MSRSPALPPARQAALSCLEGVLLRDQELQASLDGVLDSASLEPRDRALATELVYGVCRHKTHLETAITRFVHPKTRLKPRLRLILSVAAYEMLYLDRIPAYASVDWAVNAVKKRVAVQRAGVANAVLRRLADDLHNRGRPAVVHELQAVRGSNDQAWAKAYSCPEWIVRLWRRAYGDQTAASLLQASLQVPPVGLRFAPGPQGDQAWQRWRHRPECLQAVARGVAVHNVDAAAVEELEAQGSAARQSLAAQEALWALEPSAWEGPLWDGCCGRGGKTLFCRELGFTVYSSDPHRQRVQLLAQQSSRICLADAAYPPFRSGELRTVLLDVPCSGLGVLSRRPDSKWKRAPEDLQGLVRLQRRMLEAAFALLPPGGRLVYMTCTCNPEENEDQIQWLCHREPGGVLERQWQTAWDSRLFEFFYAASVVRES